MSFMPVNKRCFLLCRYKVTYCTDFKVNRALRGPETLLQKSKLYYTPCYRLGRRITLPDVSELVIFQPLLKVLVGPAGTPTPKELSFFLTTLYHCKYRENSIYLLKKSLLLLANLKSCRTPFYPLSQVILQLAGRNGTALSRLCCLALVCAHAHAKTLFQCLHFYHWLEFTTALFQSALGPDTTYLFIFYI